MNFEEALTAMRAGAKIRHPMMEPDEYFMGCYVGLPDFYDDNGKLVIETFEEKKSRGMSITKMKGDKIHPAMYPQLPFRKQVDLIEDFPFLKEKLIFPTINLLYLVSDDWEIL